MSVSPEWSLDEVVERGGFSVADDGELARGEGRAHGGERELDRSARITIPRDVREINASPVRASHFSEQFAGRFVGEVTVASSNSLFQGPGAACICFEELGAVIRFDDDDFAASQVFPHVLRSMSEICKERQRMTRREKIVVVARGEAEADGLLGIMRYGKALNVQIAKAKSRTGFEQLPVRSVGESALDGACGGGVREDADMGKFFQAVDAAGVITVFMRDENGVDPIECFTHTREERGQFSHGKAGVDEHTCAFCNE